MCRFPRPLSLECDKTELEKKQLIQIEVSLACLRLTSYRGPGVDSLRMYQSIRERVAQADDDGGDDDGSEQGIGETVKAQKSLR